MTEVKVIFVSQLPSRKMKWYERKKLKKSVSEEMARIRKTLHPSGQDTNLNGENCTIEQDPIITDSLGTDNLSLLNMASTSGPN